MMLVNMRLRSGSVHAASNAWLIPGTNVSAWFDELTRWSIPLVGMRGVILPLSSSDPSPSALLVLPPPGSSSVKPTAIHRAIAYVLPSPRLAHPADAELWPPVSLPELENLLHHDFTVFHPGIGPIAYQDADLIDLSALVAPLPRKDRPWAALSVPSIPGLVAIEPQALTLDEFIISSREDIGESGLDSIPESGQDPTLLSGLGAHLEGLLSHMLLGLTKKMPHSESGQSWINKLENWAQERNAASNARLDALRHRELSRLLKLLDEDLDQGLRYALPIGASDSHRGKAPPGARLPQRRVDFDPRQLQGGRRRDNWTVPPSMHQTLEQRYRAAAKREIGLGRHRRAAYIFSHLLNDHASAAQALELGKQWREAAALWREQLRQPLTAANCLERGEMWAEAAVAFGALNLPERQAMCLERCGDTRAATIAWQQASALATKRNDLVAAAALTDERLHDPDAALVILASTWPAHEQAAGALLARLTLLARLGRHDSTTTLLTSIAHDTPDRLRGPVLDITLKLVETYPEQTVRSRAADTGRCLIGLHLVAGTGNVQESLSRLPRLDSGDRLLARDVARWTHQDRQKTRQPPAPGTAIRLQLGQGIHWYQAEAYQSQIIAIGFMKDHLYLSRIDLTSGAVQRAEWDNDSPARSLSFFLPVGSEGRVAFLLNHVVRADTAAPIAIKRLAPTDAFPEALSAGTQGPIQPRMRIACAVPMGGWWSLIEHHGSMSYFHAPAHGPMPSIRSIQGLGIEVLEGPSWLVPVGHEPALAYGSVISLIHPLSHRTVHLSDAISNAFPHPDVNECCVLTTHIASVTASWHDQQTWFTVPFASQMRRPVAGFSRDRILVVSDGRTCTSWLVKQHSVKIQRTWELKTPMRVLAAIVQGPGLDDIVFIERDGEVRVEHIPME